MYYNLQDLDNKSGADLVQAFSQIPLDVTWLDIKGNRLNSKSAADLAQAFVTIPLGVTKLDLDGNSLGEASNADLIQVFEAIPANVTWLSLALNDLNNKSGADLAQVFKAIPASITSLGLAWNKLHNKSSADLAQALAAIPASVTSLSLSQNDLHNKSVSDLVQVLQALPAGLTALDLSLNGLNKKSGPELAQLFEAIPPNLTSLLLQSNELFETDLAQVFKAIPEGLTSLDLKRNNLGNISHTNLVQAFSQLSQVTTIDLSWNGFSQKTDSDLISLLEALPGSLQLLKLEFNPKYFELLYFLPYHVKAVDIGNREIKGAELDVLRIYGEILQSIDEDLKAHLRSNALNIEAIDYRQIGPTLEALLSEWESSHPEQNFSTVNSFMAELINRSGTNEANPIRSVSYKTSHAFFQEDSPKDDTQDTAVLLTLNL